MTYEEGLTLLSEKWTTLSPQQKMEVFTTIENHEAELTGRNSCNVEGRFLFTGQNGVVLGQYDKENRTIYINESQLSPDSKYGNSYDKLVKTVLHEGRHSYQHQAIDGKINHENKKELEEWKANFEKYISFKDDPRGYFSQIVEVDCRSYSNIRYQQMMEEQKSLNVKNQNESSLIVNDNNRAHTNNDSIVIRNSILAQPSADNKNIASIDFTPSTGRDIQVDDYTDRNDNSNDISSARDVFESHISENTSDLMYDLNEEEIDTENIDNSGSYSDDEDYGEGLSI